jgi:hypothetical protein
MGVKTQLRVPGNHKREGVIGSCRRVHNEKLLYTIAYVIIMGETNYAYTAGVRLDGKRTTGTIRIFRKQCVRVRTRFNWLKLL